MILSISCLLNFLWVWIANVSHFSREVSFSATQTFDWSSVIERVGSILTGVILLSFQASPAGLLGRFAPSGFALCARILGHCAPSSFVICIRILSCFAPSGYALAFSVASLPWASCFALSFSVASRLALASCSLCLCTHAWRSQNFQKKIDWKCSETHRNASKKTKTTNKQEAFGERRHLHVCDLWHVIVTF